MKQAALALVAVAMLATACGQTSASTTGAAGAPAGSADTSTSAAQKATTAPAADDLRGTWKANGNGDGKDAWMEALVNDGVVEVYLVSDRGDTRMLFWSGTAERPTGKTFTWTSKGNAEKMSGSILGSRDATKDFTYANGQLSWPFTMQGRTTTMRGDKVSSSAPPLATAAASTPSGPLLHVVESGFGQKGDYAYATAVVHNDAARPGTFVTVSFNLLDASGQIVASGSQTESFRAADVDLVLGTRISVPAGKTPTKVEAAAATGSTMTPKDAPVLTAGPVTVSENYGSFKGTFEVSNPGSAPAQGSRFGLVCKDAAGAIIGGGSTYPDLVPAGGKTLATAYLLTSGQPASCTATYLGTI